MSRWLHGWERIERFEDTVAVSSPCHGQQVFLPANQAVAGRVLSVTCRIERRRWTLELVADDTADGGLRCSWSQRPTSADVTLTPTQVRLITHCCSTPMTLDRAATDLNLTHPLVCPCGDAWLINFLGDARQGLRACWKPAPTHHPLRVDRNSGN